MKNKISLKFFNIFFFISTFMIIFSGLYYQYNASNKTTSENFQKENYNTSLEIREKFRLIFDKLQYKFIKASGENLDKLDELYELYKNHKEDLNLTSIENELNKNVKFGKYQVFLINKDFIIEKASYEEDIGLDLGQFEVMKERVINIFDKKIENDISSPKIDLDSRLKRYLMKLSDDEKYILEIGFSLDYGDEIKNQAHYLMAGKNTTNLYLATEIFIQDINLKSKNFTSKKDHNEYSKVTTRNFLSEINLALKNESIKSLSQTDTRKFKISLNKKLEKILPLNEKLISFVDKKQKVMNFYSSTSSPFGKNSATILFIKTSFPLKPLDIHLRENLNTFMFITILLFFVLTFFEYFRRREVTLKITSITKMIKQNKIIEDESSAIKDISVLIDSYNQMLNNLNKQIKINKELSYIDSLTQIKNRKAYDEKIGELVSLHKRYGTVFSIAIFDVDDFKMVNDTYGHSFGDTVLKDIAKALKSSTRSTDMPFRIGGEEFIVIFPGSTLVESQIVIEKIRKKVDTHVNVEDSVKTTLSIGLTEISGDDSTDSIFKRIDKFLYISKKSGKDRVTSD